MIEAIQCPHCGWQNEPTAVMCGGCGQLLRTQDPVAPGGSRQTSSWPAARSGSPAGPNADLPTMYNAPAATPAARRTGAGAPNAPAWPGGPDGRASAATRKKPGRWWRVALALLLTLAVLAAIAAAAWGLIIRPAIHTQVDNAIGGALNSAIASLPSVPEQALLAVGSKVTISQDETNALLQRELPQNTGLVGASVAYQPGVIEMTYSAYGQSGTIDTSLQVQGSQVVATNTQVNGVLGWVESGSELQTTLNQALGQLQNKTPHGFQSVQVSNGQLTVILRTA